MKEIRGLTNSDVKFNIIIQIGVIPVSTSSEFTNSLLDFFKVKINTIVFSQNRSDLSNMWSKGLPIDYDMTEISQALASYDVSILEINQLKSYKQDKKLLPIFFVATENDNVTKTKLNAVSYINNIRVEVNRTKTLQCYRCQSFFSVLLIALWHLVALNVKTTSPLNAYEQINHCRMDAVIAAKFSESNPMDRKMTPFKQKKQFMILSNVPPPFFSHVLLGAW